MEILHRLMLFVSVFFQRFKANIKAEGGGFGSAGSIIGIVLAVYVMAYTLPDAIVALANATAYGGSSQAIINIATIVLPILVLFACVMYILPSNIKAKIGL